MAPRSKITLMAIMRNQQQNLPIPVLMPVTTCGSSHPTARRAKRGGAAVAITAQPAYGERGCGWKASGGSSGDREPSLGQPALMVGGLSSAVIISWCG